MPEWVMKSDWLWPAGTFLALLLVASLVNLIARLVFVRAIRRFAEQTSSHWDDELVRARVFSRLAHIAPALVVYYGIAHIPDFPEPLILVIQRVCVAVMIVVSAVAGSRALTASEVIYSLDPEKRKRPIKGYVQVVKMVVFLIAALFVISTLMDRSPWIFLSGIGAMTAVLLLIFRDTILSLVASVQIAGNDMIHVGDWIEMPQYGADGDVIEVALHTVKVQNWDKTITTIPTHKLISESFKNWRGMSESGGRRIKRSITIDLASVRFLEPEDIERFESWVLLRDYVSGKRGELERWNARDGRNPAVNADIRRLTNLGTFRAYVWAYLRAHEGIHQEGHTLLVRQLASGPEGVPIEIYCFTRDTAWVNYENLQADLFDHLLAILPDFDLRAFQNPSGRDIAQLAGHAESA